MNQHINEEKEELKNSLDSIKKINTVHNFKPKIYVAIDFGTNGTGLAYAFPNSNEVFIHTKWKTFKKNKKIDKTKTKTAILLDQNGKFKAFGDNALRIYANMDDKDSLLFDNFKMHLFDHFKMHSKIEKIDIKEALIAKNGVTYPANKVFIEAFKHLYEDIIKTLKKNKIKQIKHINDIQWIVTVPAIWSDIAKDKMLKWINDAGLTNDNIINHCLLKYEPDCASLCIQYELMKQETLKNSESKEVISFDEVIKYKSNKLIGRKYILIDAGGGTVDIACHEILKNCSVKELLHPSGGPWGDMYVDNAFIKLLSNIFGEENIKLVRKNEPNMFLDLLENFREL